MKSEQGRRGKTLLLKNTQQLRDMNLRELRQAKTSQDSSLIRKPSLSVALRKRGKSPLAGIFAQLSRNEALFRGDYPALPSPPSKQVVSMPFPAFHPRDDIVENEISVAA